MSKTQPTPYSDHNDELVRLRQENADLKERIKQIEQRAAATAGGGSGQSHTQIQTVYGRGSVQ